jgi:hypothetical protein
VYAWWSRCHAGGRQWVTGLDAWVPGASELQSVGNSAIATQPPASTNRSGYLSNPSSRPSLVVACSSSAGLAVYDGRRQRPAMGLRAGSGNGNYQRYASCVQQGVCVPLECLLCWVQKCDLTPREAQHGSYFKHQVLISTLEGGPLMAAVLLRRYCSPTAAQCLCLWRQSSSRMCHWDYRHLGHQNRAPAGNDHNRHQHHSGRAPKRCAGGRGCRCPTVRLG